MGSVHKYFRPRSTAYACLAQTVCKSCGSSAPPQCRVSGVCVEHSQGQWHPDLRRTAYDCLMRMAAAVAGLDATINLALDAVELETAPLVRYNSSIYGNTTFMQRGVCVSQSIFKLSNAWGLSKCDTMLRRLYTSHLHACVHHLSVGYCLKKCIICEPLQSS